MFSVPSKERHMSHGDVLGANVALSVGAVMLVQWLQGSRFREDKPSVAEPF